jgi:hypothetical protein
LTLDWAILKHNGPSIAYALSEPVHVNVWRNRLDERGLAPGPWLQVLKAGIRDGAAEDSEIATPGGPRPLAELRHLVRGRLSRSRLGALHKGEFAAQHGNGPDVPRGWEAARPGDPYLDASSR